MTRPHSIRSHSKARLCLVPLLSMGSAIFLGACGNPDPLSRAPNGDPLESTGFERQLKSATESTKPDTGTDDESLVAPAHRSRLPSPWRGRAQAANFGSYNVHLESTLRYSAVSATADIDRGRALFGIEEDLETEDTSEALFEGASLVFGGEVQSNGRTCFTCHRGLSTEFGLPDLPLSDHVEEDDPLFTGIAADAGEDPRAPALLDERGLIKYKINRFNTQRDPEDPFRQVFAWRKTPNLLNLSLSHGLLTDGRARVLFEAARGAVFSHTQQQDKRFDDLFSLEDGNDMEAFLFSLFTDEALADLRSPQAEHFRELAEDPFSTVELTTHWERKGSQVFQSQCMGCHSTPNVFNNLDNILPEGNGSRPAAFPSFAPAVGRMFNIGVSERNAHNLDFRRHLEDDQFAAIELPLVDASGHVQLLEVDRDIGLAATTARLEDVGRFKVPHLRGLANNAPYFHDNSANTIEEALDHHLSHHYRNSSDGRRFPIRMSRRDRRHLIEFLRAL